MTYVFNGVINWPGPQTDSTFKGQYITDVFCILSCYSNKP